MNLIQHNTEESVIASFRNFQYSLSTELIRIGINYLIKLGQSYDPTIYKLDGSSIEIVDDLTYTGLNHYSSRLVKVKLINDKHDFLYLSIPNLIQGMFFRLNGVYYIPIYYISDEPIIIKEESVSLSSLFQPMTIYFGENRVIFMGVNIMLQDFIELMCSDWSPTERSEAQVTKIAPNASFTQSQAMIKLLSDKLNCNKTLKDIKAKMNDLFFDEWTFELYRDFYQIHPNIDNILKIAIKRKAENTDISFIDLRHKRLTFIEPLLRPYFRAVSKVAQSLIRGHQLKQIKINLGAIVSQFFKALNGNSLYDCTNGFSSIIAHKASFKNPFGKGRLPTEVSSIHFTHKGRICPSAITNTDPGQNVSLIPHQNIDLKFGIFRFSQEEEDYFKSIEEKRMRG